MFNRVSGSLSRAYGWLKAEMDKQDRQLREGTKKDPAMREYMRHLHADSHSTVDGAKAVAKEYASIRDAIGLGVGSVGGAIGGGKIVAETTAKKVAAETLSRTAAKTAAKKAATKVVFRGALKGSGIGALPSLAMDGYTFANAKASSYTTHYNSPDNPFAPSAQRASSVDSRPRVSDQASRMDRVEQ